MNSTCPMNFFRTTDTTDTTDTTIWKPGLIGSLSTRVFETRTATGREHFTCHDSGVSQIFVLIISDGEKILSSINVVV